MFKWLRGKEKQGSWKVSILFCYNWGSQCQHLHPCLFLTLFLLLYITYSLFLINGRFYQDWYRRRKKWVIHYNPKISRKAESIISQLLLFKSSPQSFPPPTHLPIPSPPLDDCSPCVSNTRYHLQCLIQLWLHESVLAAIVQFIHWWNLFRVFLGGATFPALPLIHLVWYNFRFAHNSVTVLLFVIIYQYDNCLSWVDCTERNVFIFNDISWTLTRNSMNIKDEP